MATAGLDEAAVAPWAGVLDAAERARAARFACSRTAASAFIAAHALARAALAAATGAPPAAFAFAAGAHGKPAALLGGRPAGARLQPVPHRGHGRRRGGARASLRSASTWSRSTAAPRWQVARRYFTAAEVAWLDGLPAAARPERFLRLWTLKEAFVKATGAGLTRDLAGFWFALDPPAIAFAPGAAGTGGGVALRPAAGRRLRRRGGLAGRGRGGVARPGGGGVRTRGGRPGRGGSRNFFCRILRNGSHYVEFT